ncbi:hypothetical protein ACFC0E_33025, partial [Streptomyces sp. NPDC056190]
MVTFAQAQERAEEWINGDVPAYQHREVRVREFELGFVVWAEDREGGPRLDGGAQRLVIARDSGEATLWPALPVGEVVRRYEEEYGRVEPAAVTAPAPPARVDLNQTSFLLSPPEWLQEAADRMGIPDRRGDSGTGGGAAAAAASAEAAGSGSLPQTQAGVPLGASADAGAPAGATPWAGTDTNADTGDDRSVPLPATVFAPPLSGSDDDTPPPAAPPDAKTALMAGGSALPRTAFSPAVDDPNGPVPPGTSPAPGAGYGYPQGPGGPGGPAAPGTPPPSVPGAQVPGGAGHGRPLAPNAGDIADAATSKAAPPPRRGGGSTTPPPPGAPGAPGARPGGPSTPPPPGAAGGYVPTQMVSSLGPDGPEGLTGPGAPGGTPPGGVQHAATKHPPTGRSASATPPPP